MSDQNVKTTISQFSKYQPDTTKDPVGYVVRFDISVNGHTISRDTIVPLGECKGKEDKEIADLAYAALKDFFDAEIDRLSKVSPIVGQEYVPGE